MTWIWWAVQILGPSSPHLSLYTHSTAGRHIPLLLYYFICHKFPMYTRVYFSLLLAFALGIILVSSVPVDPRSQLAEVSFSL